MASWQDAAPRCVSADPHLPPPVSRSASPGPNISAPPALPPEPWGQNSQVARQNHLISAKTPFTKRTSRRPALTAHPNPPRRPAVQQTKTARSGARKIPVFGALSQPRPQATAGDRRRPQATAGEHARAQQKKTARIPGTKAPPHLIPATWDFAHERAAEMGGGEWRPSHKAAQRSAGRMTGAIATSRFTPPGATVPM